MDRTYPRSMGPPDWHHDVRELLEAGWRAAVAYRAAEAMVGDHRLQAALQQLRLDHERHVEELASILAEVGVEVRAYDGGAGSDALSELIAGGRVGGEDVLAAMRRMEVELRDAYARCAEAAYVEPIRAVLHRHRREEEAHAEWLHESPLWSSGYDRDRHGDSPMEQD